METVGFHPGRLHQAKVSRAQPLSLVDAEESRPKGSGRPFTVLNERYAESGD
jgi:hypothetical protein